jgi:hypothetical protein
MCGNQVSPSADAPDGLGTLTKSEKLPNVWEEQLKCQEYSLGILIGYVRHGSSKCVKLVSNMGYNVEMGKF